MASVLVEIWETGKYIVSYSTPAYIAFLWLTAEIIKILPSVTDYVNLSNCFLRVHHKIHDVQILAKGYFTITANL